MLCLKVKKIAGTYDNVYTVHHVKEVHAKGLIVALVWLWRPAEPKLAGGLNSVK